MSNLGEKKNLGLLGDQGEDPLHHFGKSVLNVNGCDSPQGVMKQGHGILPSKGRRHHPRPKGKIFPVSSSDEWCSPSFCLYPL